MGEAIREIGGRVWHVEAELADLLFPRGGGGLPAALDAGRVEPVKPGWGRRTGRVALGGRALYIKEYGESWRGRRRSRREWQAARWACDRGLSTPRPVAACWQGGACFVTLDDGGRNLSDALYEGCFESRRAGNEPPYPGHRPPELARLYRRRRAPADWPQDVPRPRELARLVAELLLELHRLGLRHRDLHPGNLLLVREGGRPRLQVLDLLELEEMPGRGSLVDHLVQLNHFFEPLATRTERLRVLKMLDQRGLARRIEAATWRYRREFYRGRDGRCLRRSKYFHRVRTGRLAGFVVADWAERLPQNEAELRAALEIRQPVKLSRHESSGFGLIGGRRVFIKRDLPRPGVARLDWLLRGTRQRRAWVRANALLVRGLRTARPLAWVDLRHGLRGCEGIFVAEALDGWRSLDAALAEPGLPAHPGASRRAGIEASGPAHDAVEASGPARGMLIETVAREVRRLHQAGLSNRDLKAQNILVRYDDRAWQAAFVDMTGLRCQRRPVGRGRRIQNLMRLAFSWSGVGISGQARGLTTSDRLRFLKTYLGPCQLQAGEWRRWWADIARAHARKVRHARF